MLIDIQPIADAAAVEAAKKLIAMFRYETKRAAYDKTIKGNAKASDLLDLTTSGFASRIARGDYAEGLHYQKKSDKVIFWDRDALLEAERLRKGDDG